LEDKILVDDQLLLFVLLQKNSLKGLLIIYSILSASSLHKSN